MQQFCMKKLRFWYLQHIVQISIWLIPLVVFAKKGNFVMTLINEIRYNCSLLTSTTHHSLSKIYNWFSRSSVAPPWVVDNPITMQKSCQFQHNTTIYVIFVLLFELSLTQQYFSLDLKLSFSSTVVSFRPLVLPYISKYITKISIIMPL